MNFEKVRPTLFAPDRLRRGYAAAICVSLVVVSSGVLLIPIAFV